ncbi:MAG: methylenetetrahydrofolate reductase [Nitrospinae bacterium]|nr:methylenetetrahydrofolate reductase [Nitrospinota bacterium]
MSKLQQNLESGFTITVEIPPPKGSDVAPALAVAEKIASRVAGVNVTDNQRGMVRMSSLAFSHRLLDVGAEPIWQLSCRDRNRLALQSDMLGAWALGVENLCIMTGDFPTLGDMPQAKPVYDLDAVQLIQAAAELSRGVGMNKKEIKDHKEFFIGAVINPFYEPMELEIMKTRKKIAAGAKYFQTQPFFDEESLDRFLALVKGMEAKFLIGITPLKGEKMVHFLNNNVLTTPIPEKVAHRIARAGDPVMEGLKIAAEFINSVRGRVDGVHIMPIGQIDNVPLLLDMVDSGMKA